MHVHVSVCMSLHVTDNLHVQGSFHQCEDAYRLVEVCFSHFNVARVVVEGEADLATVPSTPTGRLRDGLASQTSRAAVIGDYRAVAPTSQI